MEEIVVTAQRRSERLQDVPISVTAQSSTDLERAGVSETPELATVVPGLLFVGQGAWVQPNLRGVSTTVTGADNPIALYLDGVYMPSQNSMIFDLPDVSRIEVLKGPQGTLFGRNATGGAIQIFTENPSFSTKGHFSVSGGVYSGDSAKSSPDYGFNGFVTGPLVGDTVAGSLSVYYDKTEGYMTDVVANQRYGEIESKMVRGKLLFQLSDNAKLVVSGFYSHRYDEAAEAGLPLNGMSSGTQYPGAIVANKPWTIADDSPMPLYVAKMYGGSARLDIDFDAGTLSSVTGYSKLDASEDVDVDATYSPTCLSVFGCIAYQVKTPDEAVSEELTFASKKFFDRLSFTSGLFAYNDRGETSAVINSGAAAFDTVIRTHAYAAFTELNYSFTDKLTAIAGVRYSWENKKATGSFDPAPRSQFADVTDHAVTPRASLRYAMTDDANVYFTYSQGFKSSVTPTNAYTAPSTKPEKINAYELGTKVAAATYAVNTAVFYYDYKDKQEQFFDGVLSFPKNAASAEIYGAELDGTLQVTDDLQTRVGVSWLPKAEYKQYTEAVAFSYPLTAFGLTQYAPYDASGARLNTTPKITVNFSTTYTKELPLGTLETTGSLYYSSEYQWEVTGRVKTGSYVTLNAQVSLAPTDRWKVALYGKNLTNRQYINSVLLDGNADMVMYAPPRLVGIKLDYSY